MGGHVAHPSYEAVCGKKTGHAEVVRLRFDPQVVTYEDLLHLFFAVHDPTTPNRQGNDVGPQYRSIVFTTSSQQTDQLRDVIASMEREGVYKAPIVTETVALEGASGAGKEGEVRTTFWPAEDYHQNYFARNPHQGYCMMVVSPKVKKAQSAFSRLLT